MNDIGDIVDANKYIQQSWTDSKAVNSSIGGFLKALKLLMAWGTGSLQQFLSFLCTFCLNQVFNLDHCTIDILYN